MDDWTEAQWQEAERQKVGNTYIKPEMLPFYRDWRGIAASGCTVLAALVFAAWVSVETPALAGAGEGGTASGSSKASHDKQSGGEASKSYVEGSGKADKSPRGSYPQNWCSCRDKNSERASRSSDRNNEGNHN